MLIIISKTLPITTVKPTPNQWKTKTILWKNKEDRYSRKDNHNSQTQFCAGIQTIADLASFNQCKIPFTVYHKNKLKYEIYFKIVGYISTIYFCDKTKGTIHKSKNKQ